jgi:hypothetical protein
MTSGDVWMHLDDTTKCSKSIMGGVPVNKDITIPCEGCPDPKNEKVASVGAGWTLCESPWPVICRQNGLYHNHCSNKDIAGIFLQTFQLDNRATNELPGNLERKVDLVIRLLKGYDEDFGKLLVVVWVDETVPTLTVATLIDTRWDTRATVFDDVKITSSYPIPSPNEHGSINLTIAIIPIGLGDNDTVDASTKCRLNVHSILGEFV